MILGLGFLSGAGGTGNPCYEVQVRLVNFTFKSANTLALCQSIATIPMLILAFKVFMQPLTHSHIFCTCFLILEHCALPVRT